VAAAHGRGPRRVVPLPDVERLSVTRPVSPPHAAGPDRCIYIYACSRRMRPALTVSHTKDLLFFRSIRFACRYLWCHDIAAGSIDRPRVDSRT
jgi:hypothetical protein